MSGLKQLDVDPANLDPNGICENQTGSENDPLTLDGALCDLGTAGQFDIGDAYSDGVGGVKLLFDSAGDVSTVIFTITGKDQDGISVTENVTGVTTTAVSTSNYYSQVTAIATSVAAYASNVFVGTVTGELATRTIPLNHHSQIAASMAVSGLTGTCQYDVQETLMCRKPSRPSTARWLLAGMM
jgi:hypothetical protein